MPSPAPLIYHYSFPSSAYDLDKGVKLQGDSRVLVKYSIRNNGETLTTLFWRSVGAVTAVVNVDECANRLDVLLFSEGLLVVLMS